MLRRYWRIRTFMLQVVEVPERVRPDVNPTYIIQEKDFYRANLPIDIKKALGISYGWLHNFKATLSGEVTATLE